MTDLLDRLPLRRRPAQSRSREKVLKALGAADRILDRQGAEALNLTSVAEEAGLTPGALYQYLPDREAILAVLAARYHARLEELLQEALEAPPQGAEDPVSGVIRSVAAVYRDAAALRSLRLGVGAGDSGPHRERMAKLVESLLLRRKMASAQTAGRVARVVFFAAHGVLSEAFRASETGEPALLEELAVMLRVYLNSPSE